MYVVATFEQSLLLELAITELEEKGVDKQNILAIPLKVTMKQAKIMDTINSADGISVFDGATVLGSGLMVLGVIYGYVFTWGPIIWGLIGLAAGFLIGLVLDLMFRKTKREYRASKSDVVVMISCSEKQFDWVSTVLENHNPKGIGMIRD
ncbi:hypothetical protein H1S01_04490 [Heliobacterium chlorum]|uniref:Uncharacterized protein n=1 Tax=Heliobacterium chlorum TaxID=2698 RepID=A0ABR7SZ04_HELCL|nr:hypothetical protein [Heliobacterium chlorum]MBC9783770.1 hypothetical protein [Heliobacterium chlorum]